jgi:hypothetical protein
MELKQPVGQHLDSIAHRAFWKALAFWQVLWTGRRFTGGRDGSDGFIASHFNQASLSF